MRNEIKDVPTERILEYLQDTITCILSSNESKQNAQVLFDLLTREDNIFKGHAKRIVVLKNGKIFDKTFETEEDAIYTLNESDISDCTLYRLPCDI